MKLPQGNVMETVKVPKRGRKPQSALLYVAVLTLTVAVPVAEVVTLAVFLVDDSPNPEDAEVGENPIM